MEEYTYTPESKATSTSCANCDHPFVEPGHPTPLCRECREALIKYPIPRWLWLFAGGIALALLFNLSQLPRTLNTAFHLIRAEKAVDAHNFRTAATEAAIVLNEYPEHLEANAYSLIAAAYNFDQISFGKAARFLSGKNIEEHTLLQRLNASADYMDAFAPSDTSLSRRIDLLNGLPIEKHMEFFDTLVARNVASADIAYAGYMISSTLSDLDRHSDARRILESALHQVPAYYPASLLLISTYRQLDELEKANEICDELLERNHQDASAMSAKSRVELRLQHMDKAKALADGALALEPSLIHAVSSQALILHMEGKKAESRQLLITVKKLAAQEGDTSRADYLRKILDGETVYR